MILSSAAKIGGPDILKNIDNLADGAWTAPAVKTAAAQWAEIGAKYMDKADEGLIHTEVQLKQNQARSRSTRPVRGWRPSSPPPRRRLQLRGHAGPGGRRRHAADRSLRDRG